MVRIGYARISDKSQNLESQLDILGTRNLDEIVEEVVSGVLEKDKLNDLVERLSDGDTLVVARHDRLGRNTLQLLELIQTLKEKNVAIEIVNLGLDSSSPFYEPLLAILSAFSEMERNQLKEKQRLGIEAAKRRGKHLGRRREFTKTQLDFAVKLYIEDNMSIKEIEETTNVSKSSLYRELDRLGIEKKGVYIAKKRLEDENKHRFDYLLSLNHEDLITEIRKIESEKPKFDFSKMNSKKLIAMNKNEVDEKTIPLNDWNKMKHFVVTDVKNSIFTYPIYDESLEYEEYNKTDYIPPEGFEFMDCSVALKPLGIAIVTIKTGRKIRNPRDGRFLSENVKRVEEIFVYSFEDEKWFVAKKNNEDYLRRLDITFYIETAYRSYLPKFYKSVDLLKKIEFYDSSMKNDEVLQRLTESRSNLNDVFKNSLFVLLFYNEFDEKMYQFFNLEIDNLIARLDRCIEYLEFLPQESFFVHTKVFDMEIEQKEALKKLNDYVDSTSIAIRQLLGNISLKRFNEAYLKGNSSVPLHQKTDFEDMIKKGYYLNPFKSTMKNINTVFGEYQPIKTLGQVLIRLLKTDFPMSEENLEYIQYEIDEFLKLHLEKANQQDWTAPCQVDSGNNKN